MQKKKIFEQTAEEMIKNDQPFMNWSFSGFENASKTELSVVAIEIDSFVMHPMVN